ncbi:MAG: diaminopimelate epimerase [Gammaproteobacteria bacterium]
MHGLGNDFMLVDSEGKAMPAPEQIAAMADRRKGIGFDQLLWLSPPKAADADVYYEIANADGSLAEQCGNGARCIVAHIAKQGEAADRTWLLEHAGGLMQARREKDGHFAVDMGEPEFEPSKVPFIADFYQAQYVVDAITQQVQISVVSMGNPHGVLQVDDVETARVEKLGPVLESHARFPNRANISFMQVLAPDRIRLRVFERGVGETSACGTGACAAVAVGRRADILGEDVVVELSGGLLSVRWPGTGSSMWLIGEAVTVFKGVIDL